MQRQRTRLAELVSYARANSPYYRKLYQKLPERVEDSTLLPVTSKNILMPCFDDWVTDREVRIEQVSKFIDNPLPAIRVQGRAADVLTFPTEHGEQVSIAPLLFGSLIDRLPGIERFQIVQTTPTSLRLRLQFAAGTDPTRVWQQVHTEITHLLTEHKVGSIALERAEEPPQQSPGGKYRSIIPFS